MPKPPNIEADPRSLSELLSRLPHLDKTWSPATQLAWFGVFRKFLELSRSELVQ
jgi:hypothetical protein